MDSLYMNCQRLKQALKKALSVRQDRSQELLVTFDKIRGKKLGNGHR
jgi:hypothetical protein